MAVKAIKMYIHTCDACGYVTSPQYSKELPNGWEPMVTHGKEFALCGAHRYGMSEKDIQNIYAKVNAAKTCPS